MGTTKANIRGWIEDAQGERDISHVIIVCDTFDWEDYPVRVKIGQDVREKMKEYNHTNMQKIMEVYNLGMDIEKQLNEHRAYHPETK